mgnify:FL=1
MNHHTLQNQQARSKKWAYHRTPELLAFYPQGTCQDLTNFNIQSDPAWEVSPCGPIPGERLGFQEQYFNKPVLPSQPRHDWLSKLGQQIYRRDRLREELGRIEERIQLYGHVLDQRKRVKLTKRLKQVHSRIVAIKNKMKQ